MKKIAIIGSGFGSLALAIRMQSKGYDVEIFEKNSQPGGHSNQIVKNGYTFDMGPSLITAPEIIENIFKSANRNLSDYLDLIPLNPFYRIYFHDKTFIDYSGDSEKMKSQMAKFNIDDANNYDRFIENSKKIYDVIITDGMGSTPFINISSMIKFIPKAIKIKAIFPAYELASQYFKDFRHRFMFSFHPLFIGGNPFKVPAIYLMISYLEKTGGVWFTKGGMFSLVKAFVKVFEEKGGKIYLNSPVEKISINEKGLANGLVVNGNLHYADIVVSNADVTHTYNNLLADIKKNKWTEDKFKKVKYSMSAFLLYLGTKKKYPELLHHTLILSPRYKELVKDIFDNKILPNDFSMYLHVPSRTDETMAPPGGESMYVLIPVTNLQGNVNWEIETNKFRDKILKFLEYDFGMKDLKENLEVCETFNPEDFSKIRNSQFGTPWGFEPILLQSAYFRPHNISEEIKNLFLVGAGTHPGGGLPGVMLSAETTEKLIEKYINN